MFILHFLNDKWEPCYVILGFSKIIDTFGNVMALQVNNFLAKHGLIVCVITYVENERGNLSTMTFTSTFIVYF